MKELQECVITKKLFQKLEELPKSLDETYERILLDIREKDYEEEAKKVLLFLAFSGRPVTMEDVAEFLVATDSSAALSRNCDILRLCSSLISRSDNVYRSCT